MRDAVLKRILAYGVLAVAMVGVYQVHQRVQETRRLLDAQIEDMKLDDSLSGNYLAARFAIGADDLKSAAHYYDRSIKVAKDKEGLIERALPAAIGAGNFDDALRLARQMDLKKPSLSSQLGVLMLLVDGFKKSDNASIEENLKLVRDDGFGRLLLPLLEAWSKTLRGNDKEAIARLQRMEADYPTIKPLANVQKALIFEIQKDFENAEVNYLKSFEDNLSLRSAWMIGQFYERQGNEAKATAVYQQMIDKVPEAPLPLIALLRMKKDGPDKDAPAKTVQDGVASALYDVASVLYQESSPRMAVLYAQLSYYLAPDDPFVNLLLGDVFAVSKRKEAAEAFYKSVDGSSDLSVLAKFRLVALYEGEGRINRAMKLLDDMAANPIVRRQALTEIADIYRRQEDFGKAVPYYTKVIDMIKKPVEGDWPVYYARAISLEREKEWKQAEADLQQALALSPNQPEVLNYLAYTWADHGKNLDKALDMLLQALEGAQQDPYITDSVGWALYKLGRYADAVPYFEAAVQGLPDDATVNDHLGDAYWKVGRRLEAQFQWKRALKAVSQKDTESRETIRKKLARGLPEAEVKVKVSDNAPTATEKNIKEQ